MASQLLKETLSSLRSLLVATLSLIITLSESLIRTNKKPSLSSPKASKPKTSKPKTSAQLEVYNEVVKEEINRHAFRGMVENYIYPALALISTVTLIFGVSRLSPIAKWASIQNECIERSNISELSIRVKSCNGGHD